MRRTEATAAQPRGAPRPREVPSPSRSRRRESLRTLASRVLVIVVVLLLWQLAATASDLVAPVVPTFEALIDEFRAGTLQEPLWSTLRAAVGGFMLAAVVALPLGVSLGRSSYARQAFEPAIVGLFSVPRLLIYPVMLSIFGIGLSAKLGLGALAAFFPMTITTMAAVRSLNPILGKVARAFNCSPLQALRKIYLPAAAPSIIAAMRLGFSVSFVTVILAEMFVTDQGLGEVVKQAYGLQQTERMFSIVALIMGGALVVNLSLWAVERRVDRSTR
jgi:NitT/TauT family transport system permease protein